MTADEKYQLVPQRLGYRSEALHEIPGCAGVHTHTSVGGMPLPKPAAVEIDMIAVAHP